MTQFSSGGLVKIIDNSGNPIFTNDASGITRTAQQFSGNQWGTPSLLGDPAGASNIGSITPHYFDPGQGLYERARQFRMSSSVAATALGATTWRTPGGGKRIRLIGFQVGVTGNASMAVAGLNVISITDSVAGNIWTNFATPWLPGAAGTTFAGFVTPWVLLYPNGYLLAVNAILQLTLGTALATGQAWGAALVNEE